LRIAKLMKKEPANLILKLKTAYSTLKSALRF
jgi:hypothetical protein